MAIRRKFCTYVIFETAASHRMAKPYTCVCSSIANPTNDYFNNYLVQDLLDFQFSCVASLCYSSSLQNTQLNPSTHIEMSAYYSNNWIQALMAYRESIKLSTYHSLLECQSSNIFFFKLKLRVSVMMHLSCTVYLIALKPSRNLTGECLHSIVGWAYSVVLAHVYI